MPADLPDRIHIGLSGWDYPSWQGDFYPVGLPARSRLAYAADHFDTVEVNGSFYSLQRPSSYRRWYESAGEHFQFALKGGRYLTHMKRLLDPDQGLANFFASGPLALAEKLGPILWQLPANFSFDEGRLAGFLDALPRTTREAAELATRHDDKLREEAHLDAPVDRPLRHAFEVRHPSFDDARFVRLLAEHDVACVVSDSPTWREFDVTTTDFTYVRLHGHSELYASGYDADRLDRWAERCFRWAESGAVYVYFDNDMRGRAPHDALALAERVSARRRRPASGSRSSTPRAR